MITPNFRTLGARDPDVALVRDAREEELSVAYSRISELETMLNEARLQIEYLHGKFPPTGTSAVVMARIDAALDPIVMTESLP